LAKIGDSGVTKTGDILGIIRYMSPERFRGSATSAPILLLGMTLYETLTLKRASRRRIALTLIDQIQQTGRPRRARSIAGCRATWRRSFQGARQGPQAALPVGG